MEENIEIMGVLLGTCYGIDDLGGGEFQYNDVDLNAIGLRAFPSIPENTNITVNLATGEFHIWAEDGALDDYGTLTLNQLYRAKRLAETISD